MYACNSPKDLAHSRGMTGPVLYPDRYAWYVLASALDVMVTITVLTHLRAREVNLLAKWTIDQFGSWGLIGLKFVSVVLVVLICEFVGRRQPRTGRLLATLAIAASLLPVTAALVQAVYFGLRGELHFDAAPPIDKGMTY